jgi:Cof subfamily protein (haloacid dehalogenase superfamily)
MTDLPLSDLSDLRGFRPQLIALDLDDTLIEHDGPVHESAVEAIARVQAMGITVVASTGRSRSTTTPVCRAAGMHDWAICSNGSLLVSVHPEEIVESVSFDPTDLIDRVRELVPNASFGVESVSGLFRTNKSFSHAALTEEIREVPFELLTEEPAIRLVIRSDEHLDQGLGFLAEELGLHSVVFGTGDVAWMDIGPKGVSKATMLARLCEREGIDPARTLAIGDSMNDREMLRWAGIGVLMGHADESMRPYADVVAGPIPGLAVAEVLNSIRG